jgi:hypothetical protein
MKGKRKGKEKGKGREGKGRQGRRRRTEERRGGASARLCSTDRPTDRPIDGRKEGASSVMLIPMLLGLPLSILSSHICWSFPSPCSSLQFPIAASVYVLCVCVCVSLSLSLSSIACSLVPPPTHPPTSALLPCLSVMLPTSESDFGRDLSSGFLFLSGYDDGNNAAAAAAVAFCFPRFNVLA